MEGDEIACGATDDGWDTSGKITTADADLQVNTWYHVACTIDTATRTWALYIDGQPMRTVENEHVADVAAIFTTDRPVYLGTAVI